MDSHRTQAEDQKMQLEIQKLSLENQQLKDEITSKKSRLSRFVLPYLTPISILATVIIAIIGWNLNIALQNQQAQHDFELKVAEVILNASSPELAANRSEALLALFPNEFSTEFKQNLQNFNPDAYVTGKSEATSLQDRQLQMDIFLPILQWVLQTRAKDETLSNTLQRFYDLESGFSDAILSQMATPGPEATPQLPPEPTEISP